jgi:hypothetical protein
MHYGRGEMCGSDEAAVKFIKYLIAQTFEFVKLFCSRQIE